MCQKISNNSTRVFNGHLSLSIGTFSTKSSHLDPNQFGILLKISGREKEDGDYPDMMTSHRSPRYRACPSAITPGVFISFIRHCNIYRTAFQRPHFTYRERIHNLLIHNQENKCSFKGQPTKTFILHGFKMCKNEQFTSASSVVTICKSLPWARRLPAISRTRRMMDGLIVH